MFLTIRGLGCVPPKPCLFTVLLRTDTPICIHHLVWFGACPEGCVWRHEGGRKGVPALLHHWVVVLRGPGTKAEKF